MSSGASSSAVAAASSAASSSSKAHTPSHLRATLIVAHDSSGGIGYQNTLPWKLRAEMRYFAQATTLAPQGRQNAVVMGRNTWDGIPEKFRPLRDRINVVLSSKSREELNLPDNVHQASSLSTALSLLSGEGPISTNLHRVFIIGGSQLYRSALDSESPSRTATATADRILLTRIVRGDEKWECDTFFPELDEQEWRQASHEEHQEWLQGLHVPEGLVEEGDVGWRYEMWVRK